MQVERISYFIPTNQVKKNGETLSCRDLVSLGYMAGRFGVNLNGNPYEQNAPIFSNDGVKFNINSCTKNCFEENLRQAGVKFDCYA